MWWQKYWVFVLLIFVSGYFLFGGMTVSAAKHDLIGQAAPEFSQSSSQDWLNSEPLSLEKLRGEVVLIDFWTFGCWNCYNSFPWLNDLEANYQDKPFRVIGVHSPEFSHEKDRQKVAQKIAEFKLKHPVMIDNDFTYWRAMHNRYWPSFYVLDKQGVIRGFYAGETHQGDSQARRIGSLISRLLKE